MSAGRLVLLFGSLLASALAAHAARAESRVRAAQTHLDVAARVVSTCSIDSSAARPVQCGRGQLVMVVRGAPIRRGALSRARIDSAHDGLFSITTINF